MERAHQERLAEQKRERIDDLHRKARRSTPSARIVIPEDAFSLAGPYGPPTGMEIEKLEGTVVDDDDALSYFARLAEE